MPLYTYQCKKCEEIYEIFHGMSEEHNECEKCGQQGCLIRLPPEFLSSLNKVEKDAKIGSLVESHIKQAKEDLAKEKKSLKRKEYV